MTMEQMNELKFPIGKYTPVKDPSPALIDQWISEIGAFPSKVEMLTEGLSNDQLNWKYRPGGWTVAQVVHHCADSHMNSFIRFKLAITEDSPTIRPYFEAKWAELPDSMTTEISDSLALLKGLHRKWVCLLSALNGEQLQRTYIHPEHGQKFNLAETIGNYAWHCNHHQAHIENALNAKGAY